jgi:hypothetical protein
MVRVSEFLFSNANNRLSIYFGKKNAITIARIYYFEHTNT